MKLEETETERERERVLWLGGGDGLRGSWAAGAEVGWVLSDFFLEPIFFK